MTTQEQKIWEALQKINDPELGFSIVDLGLVYTVVVDDQATTIAITMTMTTPACPLQSFFEKEIMAAVLTLPGYTPTLTFTFTPPWSPAKASQSVQEQFVLMGIPLTNHV